MRCGHLFSQAHFSTLSTELSTGKTGKTPAKPSPAGVFLQNITVFDNPGKRPF
jgi:hypothetical protein